jgi:hypothetical protein
VLRCADRRGSFCAISSSSAFISTCMQDGQQYWVHYYRQLCSRLHEAWAVCKTSTIMLCLL